MQSNDLTGEQLRKIENALRARMQYFRKLRERMEAEHFHPLDPLYQRVVKLLHVQHDLWVHLHYAATDVERRERLG